MSHNTTKIVQQYPDITLDPPFLFPYQTSYEATKLHGCAINNVIEVEKPNLVMISV